MHKSVLDTWEIIGNAPLEDSLKQRPDVFMQDLADFRKCRIIDSQGNERTAKPEDCIGLERAAVWEADNVEKRLLDSFMGRPNRAVEAMRVRLK